MNNIDQLPPERSIPTGRHARMRAAVLSAVAEPDVRRRAGHRRLPRRIAAAGLATVACAAIGWVGVGRPGLGPDPQVYALGDEVLSDNARTAGRQCLRTARDDGPRGPMINWPGDSRPTLLNYTEQPGSGGTVIYRAQSQLLYCLVGPGVIDGPEPREFAPGAWGVVSLGVLDASPWLPGPISVEDARSTDTSGGYVHAAGRVGKQVDSVVLDQGAGHRSSARIVDGTFVVFSAGRVKPGAGMLISYDAGGTEIDRRPALSQPVGRCYVDPSGNLVNPLAHQVYQDAYAKNPAACEPAVPW
ncbi:hypothetical protein [Plantactinospora sp. GCM10030261]|uniref:hypothetical protein n=1 Tax=Plantactinospora sp. GCM10030261 TaxID=3273420 RepID=UPI0036126639